MKRLAALALPLLLALHGSAVLAADAPLYKVEDGYKVDANTMKGFRTWRQAA